MTLIEWFKSKPKWLKLGLQTWAIFLIVGWMIAIIWEIIDNGGNFYCSAFVVG